MECINSYTVELPTPNGHPQLYTYRYTFWQKASLKYHNFYHHHPLPLDFKLTIPPTICLEYFMSIALLMY